MIQSNENRLQGKGFEEACAKSAALRGIVAEKNHYTAQFTFKGRMQVVRSELDFKFIYKKRVGYFDCKNFDGKSFPYSQIDPEQIKRAKWYEDQGIASGFIVWFRDLDRVVFFKASVLLKIGPRKSVYPHQGVFLGNIAFMLLEAVMDVKKGAKPPILESPGP